MRSISIKVNAGNILGPVVAAPPYDIDCPYMRPSGRAGLNYWKKSCAIRNRDKNLKDTCYPVCHAHEKAKQAKTNASSRETKEKLYMDLAANWYRMYIIDKFTIKEIASAFNSSSATVRRYILKEKRKRIGNHVVRIDER